MTTLKTYTGTDVPNKYNHPVARIQLCFKKEQKPNKTEEIATFVQFRKPQGDDHLDENRTRLLSSTNRKICGELANKYLKVFKRQTTNRNNNCKES